MAHIPDGFLSPTVLAGTALISTAALTVAVRRSREQTGERQAPLLGAVTAFVFAAQMFNFPLGAGTSAHLLGGVLIAAVAGPWAAMLSLFSVLLVQAFLFQDGGIAALGANTLNVAVLGAGGGWLIYRWLLALTGTGARRRLLAAGLAGFSSALVTGAAAALELALSGVVPVRPALVLVGGAHVLVGLGEGALTAAILALVVRSRPEWFARDERPPVRWVWATTGAAAFVAAAAAFVASERPDALEWAVAQLGLAAPAAAASTAPLPDYTSRFGGPLVPAALGIAVALALAWLLFRLVARPARAQ